MLHQSGKSACSIQTDILVETSSTRTASKMKNNHDNPSPLSRRDFLWQTGGLGGIALAYLLGEEAAAQGKRGKAGNREQGIGNSISPTPYTLHPTPHFAPKAKRVIQIFCMGG